MEVEKIMQALEQKHPGESEYLQAVHEVLMSVKDVYNQHPEFERASIIERIVEPERIITFRVPWVDDQGKVQVNIGYRVQFNGAIGPYKGGLRFHASVNLSILKFLGFEQTFKNALTTLPMGGGKGGSDFSPRGKSDAEIMRFCQAFMNELYRHIGPDEDVPAGDIGVGGREIGYLFGQYRKLTHQFQGMLTGKGREWGGSILRPEATGYGALYFVHQMMETHGLDIKGKTVAISGFGNVAWGAAKKATELGAKVITLSGPDGYIYDPDGISGEKIEYMLELRNSGNDVCEPYAEKYPGAKFFKGHKPGSRRQISICHVLHRTSSTVRMPTRFLHSSHCVLLRFQTWVVQQRLLISSLQRSSSSLLVRLLMQVVWLHQVSKCHRTLSVSHGVRKRLIRSSITS